MYEYNDIDLLDSKKNIWLTLDSSDGNTYVKKYISEEQAQIYRQIQSGNFYGIPRVKNIYEEYGCYVLIEEFIQGRSLQQMLDSDTPVTEKFVQKLVSFLCKTLKPIHRTKIVHRDITASNIMLSKNGEFYLIDFGNARTHKNSQSTDTEFIGTQGYAAPEQFGFGQSDRRTDIYAIGMLMNVLLTDGNFIYEKKYKGTFSKIIKKCTSVNPNNRYQNVSSLKRAFFYYSHPPFSTIPGMAVITVLTLFLGVCIWACNSDSNTQAADEEKVYTLDRYAIISSVHNDLFEFKYDEAESLLNTCKNVGFYDINMCELLVETYLAQGKVNESAQAMLEYIYDIQGLDSTTADSSLYKKLQDVSPLCTADIQEKIKKLSADINEKQSNISPPQ